jgi:AcrR family transcriptional regulator
MARNADPITPARARTRRAVLAAAARVFADRGFHGASMQVIAEEAGYTQGAIYANFGGKAELFLAVVDDRIDTQAAEIGSVLAGSEEADRLGRANAVGRERLSGDDRERQVLLGLEFLLYVVRDEPTLRAALAERYLAADEATRRMLRTAIPALADGDAEVVNELALVHSLLFEGLQVRLLADPDLLATQDAAALIERTMDAVGSAFLENR